VVTAAAPVLNPVVTTLAPAVAPVVAPVAAAVSPALAPVVAAVTPVAAPLVGALAPVTAPAPTVDAVVAVATVLPLASPRPSGRGSLPHPTIDEAVTLPVVLIPPVVLLAPATVTHADVTQASPAQLPLTGGEGAPGSVPPVPGPLGPALPLAATGSAASTVGHGDGPGPVLGALPDQISPPDLLVRRLGLPGASRPASLLRLFLERPG
jgi:hypothetical protein